MTRTKEKKTAEPKNEKRFTDKRTVVFPKNDQSIGNPLIDRAYVRACDVTKRFPGIGRSLPPNLRYIYIYKCFIQYLMYDI